MFVSNGNGFAVPVNIKRTSTSVTSQRRFSDECGTVPSVAHTTALYDACDDADVMASSRMVHGTAEPNPQSGWPC